jgi:hypothetical protein
MKKGRIMGKAADYPNGLWAITTFFNPAGYQNRRNNYRLFRERLQVPLLAVELSFDGQFELTAEDAEILIQKNDGDVMWQKERLLNIALENLPEECRNVVWLDCDCVFQQLDWAGRVCRHLEKFPLVQPYSMVHHLPRGVSPEQWEVKATGLVRPSVAWMIGQGVAASECLGNPLAGSPGIRAPGHAWAARRELLEEHKFYDACIIGGGDSALACAAYGVCEALPKLHSDNEAAFQHYRSWGESFFRSVRGEVSLVKGDLLHLWHGEMSDRRVRQRHRDLAAFQFDPATDIALTESGCWRWSSPKWSMHEYVSSYFHVRNEDGQISNAAAV